MSGLEENTIKILKATAPVIAEHGAIITNRFYEILFKEHPEQRNVFNMSNQRRGKDGKLGAQVKSLQKYSTICQGIKNNLKLGLN